MLLAYDTFLQSIVSSELAAKNGSDEPYRYECACCGEEVIIAAKNSDSMITHFRHRSGNNDVDCEKYLGKYGLISAKVDRSKSSREKVEFYFNSSTKCFYMGLRFNENEIENYEEEDVSLEIRTQKNDKPFFTAKINGANFSSNHSRMVLLERFSPVYYVSNSFNPIKRSHMIFRENSPSFFKIQGDEEEFNAKLVRSEAIYTGARYFVALAGGNGAQLKLRNMQGITIEQEFDFTFIRNHIWASVITITNKTMEIESILQQWNYTLDTPETLSLLWPPSYEIDNVSVIPLKQAFVYSTFKLQSCGNINVDEKDIEIMGSNITKVYIDKHVKILKKNADLEICFQESNFNCCEFKVEEQKVEKFFVPAKNRYYLFSRSGMRELKYGEQVILTAGSYIAEYSNGCLLKMLKATEDVELEGKELLEDIVKHYNVSESYEGLSIDRNIDYIIDYIDSCKKTGKINSLVKKYIEEGKLL